MVHKLAKILSKWMIFWHKPILGALVDLPIIYGTYGSCEVIKKLSHIGRLSIHVPKKIPIIAMVATPPLLLAPHTVTGVA